MANIIDGKLFAEKLRQSIKKAVSELDQTHQIQPGLAVVLVGEDPASQVYVRNKVKQTKEVGMDSMEFVLPVDTSEQTLLDKVDELNNDPKVNGILVQLPLPSHIDSAKVLNAISAAKDVDGFHPLNVGALAVGEPTLVPCTPLGCLMMAADYHGDLSGLNAVVVGRSNIVGKPMMQLLLQRNCTVTVVHSRSKNIAEICRSADLLVAAVGRPEMVKGDWIKPGATVIDVGINRITKEDGKTKLVGDVDFASAELIAGAITPVPGGVGPMTIACLLHNTVTASCQQNGVDLPSSLYQV